MSTPRGRRAWGTVRAVLVLFLLVLAATGFGIYAARDAPRGTPLHAVAAVVFPDYVRYSDAPDYRLHLAIVSGGFSDGSVRQFDASAVATPDRKVFHSVGPPAPKLVAAPGDPAAGWCPSSSPESSVLTWYVSVDCAEPYHVTVPTREPSDALVDRPVASAIETLRADGFGTQNGHVVIVRSYEPVAPPPPSWLSALPVATVVALTATVLSWLVTGRRPTEVELAVLCRLLPVRRRDSWCDFVRDMWAGTSSPRLRRAQMRSIAWAFPLTVLSQWYSQWTRRRAVPRSPR